MNKRNALCIAIATASIATTSVADDFVLEEITVTAQKRTESLQDVPISVSTMSGEKLQEAGIPDMQGFAAYVPNFSVTTSGYGEVISIRGIQSGIISSIEQSVGTFVDGVYRGRGAQARFGFLDVGAIEVLRGPQSTLFGKNTIGGAINVTSAAPTEELEAEISALYEVEHEETEIQGYVSGPLSDTVRGRLSLLSREMDDGWVENDYYNDNAPGTDEWAARGSLEWDVSDKLLVQLKYEHGDWNNVGVALEDYIVSPELTAAYAALGIAGDTVAGNKKTSAGSNTSAIDIGTNSYDRGDSDQVSLRADYEMAKGTLTAIYGYSTYEQGTASDAEFSAFDAIGFEEYSDYEQNNLEVRFASELGNDIEFIAGLYYQDSEFTNDIKSQFNMNLADPDTNLLGIPGGDSLAPLAIMSLLNEGLAPDIPTAINMVGSIGQFTRISQLEQETESWAAFGQVTWDINEAFHLTVGGRYGEEEKEAKQGAHCADWDTFNVNDSAANCNALSLTLAEFTPHQFDDLQRDEEDWTYTVNMQWDISPDIMAYATVSTGTKSGGFNSWALSNSIDEAEFEQEKVKSFELGAKMTLLDGAAELNVAVFDMDYDDLQAAIFTGATSYKVENAATASIRGFEMDGRWKFAESLMLRSSIGYVDFEFDEYANAGCTDAQKAALGFAGLFTKPAPGVTVGKATSVDNDGDGLTDACEQDLSGGTNSLTPQWTASLSLEHELDLGDFYLRSVLDANYMGGHNVVSDNDPLVAQDGYTLLNLTVTLGSQDDRWDVSFVGRNITDEEYTTWADDSPLFAGTQNVIWGREANYAIRGRLKF